MERVALFTFMCVLVCVVSYVGAIDICSPFTICPDGKHCCKTETCCPDSMDCCDDGEFCCTPDPKTRAAIRSEPASRAIRVSAQAGVFKKQDRVDICSPFTICPNGQHCCSTDTCCPLTMECCDEGESCCSPDPKRNGLNSLLTTPAYRALRVDWGQKLDKSKAASKPKAAEPLDLSKLEKCAESRYAPESMTCCNQYTCCPHYTQCCHNGVYCCRGIFRFVAHETIKA